MVWFEITKILIAVYENILLCPFIIIFGTRLFPIAKLYGAVCCTTD